MLKTWFTITGLIVASMIEMPSIPEQVTKLYRVVDLGKGSAYAINDKGLIAGELETDTVHIACLWRTEKQVQLLDTTAGYSSKAVDINVQGDIIGLITNDFGTTATRWRNGKQLKLFQGAVLANGINDRGQVIGVGVVLDKKPVEYDAFLWENSQVQRIVPTPVGNCIPEGINNKGQVVGSVQTNGEEASAFFWEKNKFTRMKFGGMKLIGAKKINSEGVIIGNYETSKKEWHALVWEKEKMKDLGTLGGPESEAFDINNHGHIVGSAETSAKDKRGNHISHAFLYDGKTMQDLNNLILKGSGWELIEARSINTQGHIVGWGMFNGEGHAFLLKR